MKSRRTASSAHVRPAHGVQKLARREVDGAAEVAGGNPDCALAPAGHETVEQVVEGNVRQFAARQLSVAEGWCGQSAGLVRSTDRGAHEVDQVAQHEGLREELLRAGLQAADLVGYASATRRSG